MGKKPVKDKNAGVSVANPSVIVRTTNKYDKKRLFVVVCSAVIALGMLSYGIYAYVQRSKAVVPLVELPSNLTSPEQKAAFYAQNKDYPSARQIWLKELKASGNTEAKLSDYSKLVGLALQFNKYADAQKYSNGAKKLDPASPTPYVLLAQVAMAKGEKATAKGYWEQAISKVDKSKPGSNIQIDSYQSHLDSLK